MISEKFPGLKDLPDEEKLQLAGKFCDDLAERPDSLPQREDHVKLLQERLEHFRQHPEEVVAWEAVKARLLACR